jgi:hypothetical protein
LPRLTNSTLGLAFTHAGIACALLDRRGALVHAEHLSLDPAAGAETTGAALAEFCREHGVSASCRVVIGLPARWLVSHRQRLPQGDQSARSAALRLAGERMSAEAPEPILVDAPATGVADSLLVAATTRKVQEVGEAVRAAGLKPAAVTSTGLALANAFDPQTRSLLLTAGTDAELVTRDAGHPVELRHVTTATDAARARALLTAGDDVLIVGGNEQTARWTADGQAGLRPRSPAKAFDTLTPFTSLNGDASRLDAGDIWQAVALAALLRKDGPPIDFLNSTLAAPAQPRLSRRQVVVAALVLIVLGASVALWQRARSAEAMQATLLDQLDAIEADVVDARAGVARIRFGRGFFDRRPPVLACFDDFSRVLGRETPAWLTGITLDADLSGNIQGQATSEDAVLTLRRNLEADPRFEQVRLEDLRDAGRVGGFTFAMEFDYVPEEAEVLR